MTDLLDKFQSFFDMYVSEILEPTATTSGAPGALIVHNGRDYFASFTWVTKIVKKVV
jgi:hypothetical protein